MSISRATFLGVMLLAALSAAPASGALQQNANADAYWTLPPNAGIWNVDQSIQIREAAPSTYWAGYWQWTNTASSSGGYFGLQENGIRFDGKTGPTAIFSVWNASAIRGPSCGTFAGEGSGYSCRIAYPIQTDRAYRLRLWRQEVDGSGQWWGAWIQDLSTGVDELIGEIRAPLNATAVGSYMNFTEYFGPAVAANDRVPRSVADYAQPMANQQSPGVYELTGSFSGSHVGSGTVGTVEPTALGSTAAARITMGGATGAPASTPPPPPPGPAERPALTCTRVTSRRVGCSIRLLTSATARLRLVIGTGRTRTVKTIRMTQRSKYLTIRVLRARRGSLVRLLTGGGRTLATTRLR